MGCYQCTKTMEQRNQTIQTVTTATVEQRADKYYSKEGIKLMHDGRKEKHKVPKFL